MTWLKNILSPIYKFFSKIFSPQSVGVMIAFFDKYAHLVQMAYPVVKQIAIMTPTKTDDRILAAYEHFNLKDLFDPTKDRRVLLRDLAKAVIVGKLTDPVEEYILNTAVELAYTSFKEETKAIAAASN